MGIAAGYSREHPLRSVAQWLDGRGDAGNTVSIAKVATTTDGEDDDEDVHSGASDDVHNGEDNGGRKIRIPISIQRISITRISFPKPDGAGEDDDEDGEDSDPLVEFMDRLRQRGDRGRAVGWLARLGEKQGDFKDYAPMLIGAGAGGLGGWGLGKLFGSEDPLRDVIYGAGLGGLGGAYYIGRAKAQRLQQQQQQQPPVAPAPDAPYVVPPGAKMKSLAESLDPYYGKMEGGVEGVIRRAEGKQVPYAPSIPSVPWKAEDLHTKVPVVEVPGKTVKLPKGIAIPGAENETYAGVTTPMVNRPAAPPAVITMPKDSLVNVHDQQQTVGHELTHSGMQMAPIKRVLERGGTAKELANLAKIDPEITSSGQKLVKTLGGTPSFGPKHNLNYLFSPDELDPRLALVKRVYAQNTGREVTSPAEAKKALDWFKGHVNSWWNTLNPSNLGDDEQYWKDMFAAPDWQVIEGAATRRMPGLVHNVARIDPNLKVAMTKEAGGLWSRAKGGLGAIGRGAYHMSGAAPGQFWGVSGEGWKRPLIGAGNAARFTFSPQIPGLHREVTPKVPIPKGGVPQAATTPWSKLLNNPAPQPPQRRWDWQRQALGQTLRYGSTAATGTGLGLAGYNMATQPVFESQEATMLGRGLGLSEAGIKELKQPWAKEELRGLRGPVATQLLHRIPGVSWASRNIPGVSWVTGKPDESAIGKMVGDVAAKSTIPFLRHDYYTARQKYPNTMGFVDAARLASPFGLAMSAAGQFIPMKEDPAPIYQKAVDEAIAKYTPEMKANPIASMTSPIVQPLTRTLTDPRMRQHVMDSPVVQKGVQQLVTSPETQKFIGEQLNNPQGQAMLSQTLNDPKMQQFLANTAANPAVQKAFTQSLTNPDMQKTLAGLADQPEVTKAITNYASTPEGQKTIGGLFQKPEVMGAITNYANTPEGQKTIGGFFQRPEVTEAITNFASTPEGQKTLGGLAQQPAVTEAIGNYAGTPEGQKALGGLAQQPKVMGALTKYVGTPEGQKTISGLAQKPEVVGALTKYVGTPEGRKTLGEMAQKPEVTGALTNYASTPEGQKVLGEMAQKPEVVQALTNFASTPEGQKVISQAANNPALQAKLLEMAQKPEFQSMAVDIASRPEMQSQIARQTANTVQQQARSWLGLGPGAALSQDPIAVAARAAGSPRPADFLAAARPATQAGMWAGVRESWADPEIRNRVLTLAGAAGAGLLGGHLLGGALGGVVSPDDEDELDYYERRRQERRRNLMSMLGMIAGGVAAPALAYQLGKKAEADYAPGLPSRSNMGQLDKLQVGQMLDYIVQRHEAERAGLHHDIRFGNPDMGLLSWAARKGVPPPGERHLAVQQPVHRHEYGNFEGEIPQGYGKGTVKTHTKGQILITKATPESIHFTTAHQRHPERFTLVRPKGWGNKNWLLMNTTPRDQVPYEKVRYKKIAPEDVEPALKAMQEGDTVEAKVDGASQLIRLAGGHAEALSFRTSKTTGRPIFHTERLFGGRPEVPVPRHLEGSILKGELYASRLQPGGGSKATQPDTETGRRSPDGGPDVGTGHEGLETVHANGTPRGSGAAGLPGDPEVTTRRTGPQDVGQLLNSSIARSLQLQKAKGLTLRNMLYDVQQYGKKPIDPAVTSRSDRRRMLEEIAGHLPSDKFHVSEEFRDPASATKLWDMIRSGEHPLTEEGIVYHPRTGVPSKAKLFEEHDVHVTGTFPGEGQRAATVGGLTYGHEPGKTVGRVGTGFSDETLADIARDPSAYIGRVARVRAQQKLPSGALRVPSFLGLHEDINKVASHADTAATLKLAGLLGITDPPPPVVTPRSRRRLPPPAPSWWDAIQGSLLGKPNAIIPEVIQQIEEEEEKTAKVHPALADLKLAKAESDRKNYRAKYQILSRLIHERPSEFKIDSTIRDMAGLTHKPTGFRIHASLAMVGGRLKVADWVRTNTVSRGGKTYDIDDLVSRTAGRKVENIPLGDIEKPNRSASTGYSKKRYAAVNMNKPILVGIDGTLWDGRHRLSRHIDEGLSHIRAVRVTPEDLDAVVYNGEKAPKGDPIDKSRIRLLPAKAAAWARAVGSPTDEKGDPCPAGECCPKCHARLERDPDDGKCNRCGHSWGEKRADLLPWVRLQPQQERVAKRVGEGQNLLVYHGLGSGKSLASLAAAEETGGPFTAVVPASLRGNYLKELGKFTDQSTPTNVMSYTGIGMGKQPSVTPNTVIMDEVQRIRNPQSAGARAAMELGMRAPHRILLSGTPIVNAPSDLAVPLSILRGEEMSPGAFTKKYVGNETVNPGFFGWLQGVKPVKVPKIQNEEDLERMLEGHVDYQPSRTPEGVSTKDERVEVDMGSEQQDFYKLMWGKLPWLMRWKLSNDYPLTKQEIGHLSAFMTGPRQAALSLYPYHSSHDPIRAFQTSSKLQSAMSHLQETLAKDPRAKAIIYSNFIDAGLTPYAAGLAEAKIPFGQFHGSMPEEARKKALDDYNSGRSRVLLLGPAAAEGISAKGTQLIQLLDPHWNEARLGQARGRGLRFDSHEGLPEELRHVKIQRFVAKMPPPGWLGKVFGEKPRPSADEVLERMSERKEELNEQFREVLRRVGSPGYQRPWSLFG
jgi:hypothetical protein